MAEGVHISSSLFVDCTFEDTDLYWCHAFQCHFVNCEFSACDLRGSFDESVFVRCQFQGCEWGRNELGGETLWEGAAAIECLPSGVALPIIPSTS